MKFLRTISYVPFLVIGIGAFSCLGLTGCSLNGNGNVQSEINATDGNAAGTDASEGNGISAGTGASEGTGISAGTGSSEGNGISAGAEASEDNGTSEGDGDSAGSNLLQTMEPEAVLEYDTGEQNPRIIVDVKGYNSIEEKYAILIGDEIPETFDVVNSETGETVFTGIPEEAASLENGDWEKVAKLEFADVTDEGTYHIAAESYGVSYDFAIAQDVYTVQFNELLNNEFARANDHSADAEEIFALLYVYEKYTMTLPESEADVPEVLIAVRNWIGQTDFDNCEGREAYLDACVLAKFSVDYKSVDKDAATECLRKAVAIYNDKADAAGYPEEHYLASVEIYRASGKKTYAEQITGMYDYIDAMEHPHDSWCILYGSIDYMTTKQTVDRDMCDMLMDKLLCYGEDVMADKKLLDPYEETPDVKGLLGCAQEIQALNYVLDDYEYNGLIVNIVHYLNGRNYTGFSCSIPDEHPADALIVYAWITELEIEGKLDSSALTDWEYNW